MDDSKNIFCPNLLVYPAILAVFKLKLDRLFQWSIFCCIFQDWLASLGVRQTVESVGYSFAFLLNNPDRMLETAFFRHAPNACIAFASELPTSVESHAVGSTIARLDFFCMFS